jgi:integrase
MLTLRKRGKTWHVRGTVRVGRKVRDVNEHSTGCRERPAAEAYKSKLEHEIREELLHGAAGRAQELRLAAVLLSYIERPGLSNKEVWYAGQLGEVIGDRTARDLLLAWQQFLAKRCPGLAPATVNRFRSVLVAALNHGGIGVPRDLRPLKVRNVRLRYLTRAHQEALLAAHDPHARPIALLLCYTGARTQEALQVQWPDVDLGRGTVLFTRTKSGRARMVPLPDRVREALAELWRSQGRPTDGHVFRNRRGQPYSDHRTRANVGGNPLYKVHAAACRRAGIRDFTPHDWRHHWASWCVMSGIDLPTVQRLGGWATLQMVERYAAVDVEHMAAAVRKLA